jgi:hypothetical protein
MRNFSSLIVLSSLSLSACGSDSGTGSQGTANAPSEKVTFTPPALPDGYTRFRAETIVDVGPGDDVTHCQYVMAPLDRDMDVVDVQGSQSAYGHHGVAFSYVPADGLELGSEIPCMMGSNEFSTSTTGGTGAPSGGGLSGGGFLGAVGPVAGRAAALPEGVAFRLPKGQGIQLNLHYINTSMEPVKGRRSTTCGATSRSAT